MLSSTQLLPKDLVLYKKSNRHSFDNMAKNHSILTKVDLPLKLQNQM